MSVIDDYLGKLNDPEREALERIRRTARGIAPDLKEVISYGMPVLKYKGKYLIGFSAFKAHLSIFPGPEPIEALKDKLGGFKLAKGTVQFTPERPIPDAVIKEMLRIRINDIDQA